MPDHSFPSLLFEPAVEICMLGLKPPRLALSDIGLGVTACAQSLGNSESLLWLGVGTYKNKREQIEKS